MTMNLVQTLLISVIVLAVDFASAVSIKKDAQPNVPRFTMDEIRNVKVEIKDVNDFLSSDKFSSFLEDIGETEDTLLSDDKGSEEVTFKTEKLQDDHADEPRFHATITDKEFGAILREDEEEVYLKTSRFVTDEDKHLIYDEEKAITVDEARRKNSIHVDDDGSPEFLEKNGEELYERDAEIDEEIRTLFDEDERTDTADHADNEDIDDIDKNRIVKRRAAWGIRWGSVGKAFKSAGKSIGHAAKSAYEAVATAVTDVVHKGTQWIHGAVKTISDSDIGKFIGKAAEKVFEFAKCAIPGLNMIEACLEQAISSIGESCSGNDCHIMFGGSGTGCLVMGGDDTVMSKTFGPVTVTGTVGKEAGFTMQYFFQTGKIILGFYGHISIKPKLTVSLSKTIGGTYKKKIPLTSLPFNLFRKLFVITIGGIPIPILLEVRVQPMAKLSMKVSATGTGSLAFELTDAARVDLEGLTISYDPKSGPRADLTASHNLNNLQITKTLTLTGSAFVEGAVLIGPDITVAINGIPIVLFPAIEFKAKGTLQMAHTNGATCVGGSLQFSTSLMALIIPDIQQLTSVSGNFGSACRNFAHMSCKLNPAVAVTHCLAKTFLGIDLCNELIKGCDEMEKQLEIIPDLVQNNPILATLDFLRRGLAEIHWGNMNKCSASISLPAPAVEPVEPVVTVAPAVQVIPVEYEILDKRCLATLGSGYTWESGTLCDGWAGLTVNQCQEKCTNNEVPDNCPQQSKKCAFAQLTTATGKCHLMDDSCQPSKNIPSGFQFFKKAPQALVEYELLDKRCLPLLAYTLKIGLVPTCDGWSDLTVDQCQEKCTNNKVPENCPQKTKKCGFFQHNTDNGKCHLMEDTCQAKYAIPLGFQFFKKAPAVDTVVPAPVPAYEYPQDCSRGDVRIYEQNGWKIAWVYDSAWKPICGHWFWDNEHGANIICKALGHDLGGSRPDPRKKSISIKTYQIGKCKSTDTSILGCTDGHNDRQFTSKCAAGKNTGYDLVCLGDGSGSKDSCRRRIG